MARVMEINAIAVNNMVVFKEWATYVEQTHCEVG